MIPQLYFNLLYLLIAGAIYATVIHKPLMELVQTAWLISRTKKGGADLDEELAESINTMFHELGMVTDKEEPKEDE